MSSGLMKPTPKQSDLLRDIKRAFGPVSSTPLSLEQQLQSLNESELNLVLTTAQMVKMAHGFTRNNTEPYSSLVSTMYPRMNAHLRSIIAAMLQEADPITLPPAKPKADVLERTASETQSFTGLGSKPQYRTPQPDDRTATIAQDDPTTIAGDMAGLMSRLAISESSNNPNAEITLKDGRRYVGLLQFGEARLKDYQAATGKKFTQDEFKADEALQDEVAQWHIADLDKAIDKLGDKAKAYSRDGLRAVAHLGGKTGMKKFVQSAGKHNPSDELGTSLQVYYDKFSSKT